MQIVSSHYAAIISAHDYCDFIFKKPNLYIYGINRLHLFDSFFVQNINMLTTLKNRGSSRGRVIQMVAHMSYEHKPALAYPLSTTINK
jgi:hypothetical protein